MQYIIIIIIYFCYEIEGFHFKFPSLSHQFIPPFACILVFKSTDIIKNAMI